MESRRAPAPFPPAYRGSGVLLHVTSLPSRYGIGDLGPSARAWVDRLADAGQSCWQSLPLGPTGYGNSPYQPLSSFAGNELLVSPEDLIEDGLLCSEDCAGTSFCPTAVDYAAVMPFKRRVFEAAWGNFAAGRRADLHHVFDDFCEREAHWLEDYALFRALKVKWEGANYLEWPVELVERSPVALSMARWNSLKRLPRCALRSSCSADRAVVSRSTRTAKACASSATCRSTLQAIRARCGPILDCSS